MRLPRILPAAGLALAGATLLAPAESRAQVAYAPGVGTIPDGVALTAVPAVSADRRYVRLSIGANFQTVDGFQAIGVPFAVSGLGSGGGNLGGLGGLGAGAGGGAGLRSVGVPMGMDGPAPGGLAAPARFDAPGGTMTADASASFDETWTPPRRARSTRTGRTATRKPAPAAAKQPAAAPRPRSSRRIGERGDAGSGRD